MSCVYACMHACMYASTSCRLYCVFACARACTHAHVHTHKQALRTRRQTLSQSTSSEAAAPENGRTQRQQNTIQPTQAQSKTIQPTQTHAPRRLMLPKTDRMVRPKWASHPMLPPQQCRRARRWQLRQHPCPLSAVWGGVRQKSWTRHGRCCCPFGWPARSPRCVCACVCVCVRACVCVCACVCARVSARDGERASE